MLKARTMKSKSFRILIFLYFLSAEAMLFAQFSNEWIIKINEPSALKDIRLQIPDAELEAIFPDLNLYVLRSTNVKSHQITALKSISSIDYLHDNIRSTSRRTPNDPSYPGQWSLPIIEASKAWDISVGALAPNGDDIVVAIFDDGYQVDHPDYASNVWINKNEIPDNGLDDDQNGFIDDYQGWNSTLSNDNHRVIAHGTSVAGIIGAVGDNGNQIAGINWNVKLMLTSAGRNDFITLADIVKGYNYIYAQRKLYNETSGSRGAYVVVSNYSGGAEELFPSDFPAWCEVYDALGSVGVLNVTSAPNADVDVEVVGDLPTLCPSPYLIVVTNTDKEDNKVKAAGYGSISVDMGAPGDGILTTGLNSQLDTDFPGTSAAAPHVAGSISLLYSIICEEAFQRSLSRPSEIALIMKDAILTAGDDLFALRNITTSGKRLNVFKSIKIIDSSIGNCCKITLADRIISDESCQGAADITLTLPTISQDISGNIEYRLSIDNQEIRSQDSIFQRLSPGSYALRIVDTNQENCSYEENILLQGSTTECPFGEFGIEEISPNPASESISIRYNISEQQLVNILIYNNLGQLMYHKILNPEFTAARIHTVDVASFPAGIYHVTLRATSQLSTKKILVINY